MPIGHCSDSGAHGKLKLQGVVEPSRSSEITEHFHGALATEVALGGGLRRPRCDLSHRSVVSTSGRDIGRDGCPYCRHVPDPYVGTMKNKKQAKRLDLELEIVADLELSEQETDAIVGGRNYTRVPTVAN